MIETALEYTITCPFCLAILIAREGPSTPQEVADNIRLFGEHVISKHPSKIVGFNLRPYPADDPLSIRPPASGTSGQAPVGHAPEGDNT